MHILALLHVLLSLARAADIAPTAAELDVKKYLEDHRQAAIQVFLDSTQEAPEADVDKVKKQLGYFALHMSVLVEFLSESYAVRCWERDPTSRCAKNQVCSVSMDSSSDFGDFIDVLSCEQALNFYLLPPGRFRESVRQKAMTGNDFEVNLYSHIMSQNPALPVPYKEALVDVQMIFTEPVIKSLKGRVAVLPYSNSIQLHETRIGQKHEMHCKIGLPMGGQGILAAVFPANTHTLLLDRPQAESEQAQGKVSFVDPNNPQAGIPFENIIVFECLRLADPISNTNVNVMECLNDGIWELAQLWAKSKSRPIKIGKLFHAALVEAVLVRNPEALLLNPNSTRLDYIAKAAKRFAKSYLDALVDRIMEGKLAVAHIDKRLLEYLVVKVEDNWDRKHYRRFLSDYGKQLEKPTFDHLVIPNVAPADDAFPFAILPADIMSILPSVPAGVTKAFNTSSSGANAANLKIFLEEMCGSHGRSGLTHAFYKLRHMKSTKISECNVEAAQMLLMNILTAREVDEVLMYDFHEKSFPCSEITFKLEYRQRYMLHSLIFMTGSFEPRKKAETTAKKTYWDAFETIAWVFHPHYVEKLRTVRANFEELKNIEMLIQCPHVDKRWTLEQYGVLESDESNSRSVLRLFNSDKIVAKCVAEGFWHGMGDSSNNGLLSVRRNIKILEFAVNNGKMDAVRSVLNIPSPTKMLIDLGILDIDPVDVSGPLNLDIFKKWFDFDNMVIHGTIERAENQLAALDQNKLVISNIHSDIGTVQKVIGMLCQREFQRVRTSPWPRDNIHKLMKHCIKNRSLTIWIINRCCQLARTPGDFENFFQLFTWFEQSEDFVKSIILDFATAPEVDVDFKVYCSLVAANRACAVTFSKIINHTWWHVLGMVRDKHLATQMLIKECRKFDLDLDEDTIYFHLKSKNNVEPHGYLSLSKISIKDVTKESKKLVLLFVNGNSMLVPSNATAKHLYGIVHHMMALNFPFVLIDEVDGKEVALFDDSYIERLAYHRLKVEQSRVLDVLKIDLGEVFMQCHAFDS